MSLFAHRSLNLTLIAAAASLLVAGSSARAAYGAAGERLLVSLATAPQGPALADMQDAAAFIEQMYAAAAALNDYVFDSKMVVYRDDGTVKEEARFWYKKPRLMRFEVTGRRKKGSVAVLQKDGKVRAHMGGAMKFFVVTLPQDSDHLRCANGYPICKTDLLSLADYLRKWLNEGVNGRVSKKPIFADSVNQEVRVLEMYRNANPKQVLKRVLVDPQTGLPVEWYDYENGKLWSISTWSNLRTNTGLPESIFQIKEN